MRLEKDKLQIADMDYVVKAYLEYLYRVDQTSRSKDIEAALRLMVPGQAKKFAQYLTDQKILQTQSEQQWNSDDSDSTSNTDGDEDRQESFVYDPSDTSGNGGSK